MEEKESLTPEKMSEQVSIPSSWQQMAVRHQLSPRQSSTGSGDLAEGTALREGLQMIQEQLMLISNSVSQF